MISFSKYHGLGNDFLVVDSSYKNEISKAQAIALCDRHTGVGGDGILFVDRESPRMDVINSDGSVPEMCGNGLRCVVAYLAKHKGVTSGSMVVATLAGPHHCELSGGEVRVSMRPATITKASIPVNYDSDVDEVIDAPFDSLRYKNRPLKFSCVSMGNPHAITFDVPKQDKDARLRLGPVVGASKYFPEGVNVSFADVNDGVLELSVFERGAGWTQACGTGACAAAVAAVKTQRFGLDDIPVRLPGGLLTIKVPEDLKDPIIMRGPAEHVFDGTAAI